MIVNNLVNDIIRAYTEGKNVPWWSSGETWESIRLPDGYEKPPKEEFEIDLAVHFRWNPGIGCKDT